MKFSKVKLVENNHFFIVVSCIAVPNDFLAALLAKRHDHDAVRARELLLIMQFYLLFNVAQDAITIAYLVHRELQFAPKLAQKLGKFSPDIIAGDVVRCNEHMSIF